ncbi:MAG: hypothetical protein L0I48_05040 [Lactococcus plantarum]|nr:hypothetical protein [Lactococcus plantarum]MDN6085047.1 hypothetical protein [Lactococcus plantarum]
MFDTENDLTTEQRAHDLALLTVQAEINRKLISQLHTEDNAADSNIYELYLTAYKDSLEAVNKDF